jgi:hypothetical protein
VISLAATPFQESLCSLKFMVGKFVNNLHRCHSMLENTIHLLAVIVLTLSQNMNTKHLYFNYIPYLTNLHEAE